MPLILLVDRVGFPDCADGAWSITRYRIGMFTVGDDVIHASEPGRFFVEGSNCQDLSIKIFRRRRGLGVFVGGQSSLLST
jgi:hypothetical protein